MRIRTAAATIATLLTLAACAEATPTGAGSGIGHSAAPDHVLVRVAWEGGFVPVEATYTNLPLFSLYGDGTLVVPGAQIEIYPPPALPAMSERAVDEQGIQAILRDAIGETADLPDDLDDMGMVMIADAPTTVITVSVDDVERTVRVYALGEMTERPEGMPEDVFRARQRLQELVTKLTGLSGWLPAGSLGPESDYEADASGRRAERRPVRAAGDRLAARTAARDLRRAVGRRRAPVRRRAGRRLVDGPRRGGGGEPGDPVGGRRRRLVHDPVPTAPPGRIRLLTGRAAAQPERPVKSPSESADASQGRRSHAVALSTREEGRRRDIGGRDSGPDGLVRAAVPRRR
jgi:hypothetical protein